MNLNNLFEGLDGNQKKVGQLPAEFDPTNTSPVLDGPYGKHNATQGHLVGESQHMSEGRVKELEMDIVDPAMSDSEFATKYEDSRANMARELGMTQDRKTGRWYNPDQEFDRLRNSPEFGAQMRRMAQQEDVAEGDVFRRHDKNRNPTIPELEMWIKNWTSFQIGGNLTDAGRAKVGQSIAKAQRLLAKKKQQQGVAEGSENKLTPQQKAHERNLDAAQREMDRRHTQGEDMTGAKIDKKTYKIVKPKKQGVAEGSLREFAMGGDDGEDPTDNYPCYDCGSTIFLHHTKLCELAEDNAIRDLPAKLGTQYWTGQIPKGLVPIPGLAEGVAEGPLSEFAVSGDGDGGDDSLFNYAKFWYNGDLKIQKQVERALQKSGLDIGENEDENGGAYISDKSGDYYESWTAEDLKQGVAEGQITVESDLSADDAMAEIFRIRTRPGLTNYDQFTPADVKRVRELSKITGLSDEVNQSGKYYESVRDFIKRMTNALKPEPAASTAPGIKSPADGKEYPPGQVERVLKRLQKISGFTRLHPDPDDQMLLASYVADQLRGGSTFDRAVQMGTMEYKRNESGVTESSVAKYADIGATNSTTHFIKNITTGKIVSPHRSLRDAQDALVGNERGSNHKFKIVRAKKSSVAEGSGQSLSVQQLATISDAALDQAYGYGRSTPGNSFGWQANLMSAAYAKKLIDAGVTDIEKISDAIHKGWNVTAQKFVQNPEQFDDTEKLRQAGKLDAKLQQRAKLMKINYAQLDNEEQEKDRVVARALLQAIKGQQGVAGNTKYTTPRSKGHGRYNISIPRRLLAKIQQAFPEDAVDDIGEWYASAEEYDQPLTVEEYAEYREQDLSEGAGTHQDLARMEARLKAARSGQVKMSFDAMRRLSSQIIKLKFDLGLSESTNESDEELYHTRILDPQTLEVIADDGPYDWENDAVDRAEAYLAQAKRQGQSIVAQVYQPAYGKNYVTWQVPDQGDYNLEEQDLAQVSLNELAELTRNYYTLSNGKTVQVIYRPNINQSPIPLTGVKVSYVNPALQPQGGSFDSTGQAERWDSAPDGVKQAIEKFVKQPGMTETALRDKADLVAKRRALQDLSRNSGVDQKAVQQRQQDLEKEARSRDLAESVVNGYAVLLNESVKRVFPIRVMAESYAAQLQQRRPTDTVSVAEQRTTEDLVSGVKDRIGDYLQNVADAVKKDPALLDKIASTTNDLGPAVKTLKTADGHEIKIHGNEDDGFRISISNQALKSRFPKMEHAVMATEMYCARRQQQTANLDYLPEA